MVRSSGNSSVERLRLRDRDGRIRTHNVVFGAPNRSQARAADKTIALIERSRRLRASSSAARRSARVGKDNLDNVVFDRPARRRDDRPPREAGGRRSRKSRAEEALAREPRFVKMQKELDDIVRRSQRERRTMRSLRRDALRNVTFDRRDDRRSGRRGDRRPARRQTMDEKFGSYRR